jgi:multiple sugar transport system ATP-binding protein
MSDSAVTVRLTGIGDLDLPARSNDLKPDDPVTVGVRAERLAVNEQGQFQGQVLVAERLGSETYLHVQMEGGEMVTIEINGDSPARIHDRVAVQIKAKDCHLFNSSGEAI